MTKSTTRRFLCCLLALCCLLGSLDRLLAGGGDKLSLQRVRECGYQPAPQPLVGGEQHHRPYPEGNDSDRHGAQAAISSASPMTGKSAISSSSTPSR